MKFSIEAKPGSPGMVNAGILGTANITIWNDDKTKVVFQLEEFHIRRSNRDGQLYLLEPSKEYTSRTDGQKKYQKLVRIPDEEIKGKITGMVISAYQQALAQGGGQPAAPGYTPPPPPANGGYAPPPAAGGYAPPPPPPPAPQPAPAAPAPAPAPAGNGMDFVV